MMFLFTNPNCSLILTCCYAFKVDVYQDEVSEDGFLLAFRF